MAIGKEALAKARRFIQRDGEQRLDMLNDNMAARLRKREGKMVRVQARNRK